MKQQFKHRMIRLYPPYIAVLILASFYALLIKAIPYDMPIHLLSAQNFLWMITDYKSVMQPITAHTWTLSIEVWGGFVWLFLLRIIPKERFKFTMYGMLLIGILYRVWMIILGADVWAVSLCPIAHFDAFACGSLLAIRVRENKVNRKNGFLSIVGLAGIIACIALMAVNNQLSFLQAYMMLSSSKNYLNNWFTGNIYFFISLFTIGIVGNLYYHDEKRVGEIGKMAKMFATLGDHSYILYLFHWPILLVVTRFARIWIITFPFVLVVSIVAMRIFNKLYDRLQKIAGGKMA